ncbi:ankyrin-3-like [Trichogramma pretiosum]|uniref:ankyrin-3-like n=1 Tax=Trichogramma pretiosum TaxID=7493 RepID=UPI0006C9AC49|nr:ankyrin-3-like [Trichogramma pretiosum]
MVLGKHIIPYLKDYRDEGMNWEIDHERIEFIGRINDSLDVCEDEIPNFRHILSSEQIDRLVTDSINMIEQITGGGIDRGKRFIGYVARSGYKDQPKLDEDGPGVPLLQRTTPLHHAFRCGSRLLDDTRIAELFAIYNNRFDANIVDESGLSHFHVACYLCYRDAVERFLDHGQDPNCIWPETGQSPLHLALQKKKQRPTLDLLLRRGADPNYALENGATPLHVACRGKSCDPASLKLFFEARGQGYPPVRINAQDRLGNTPLHDALNMEGARLAIVKFLLQKGANPNMANEEGSTPLHVVSEKCRDVGLLKAFFELSQKKYRPLKIDAQDEGGRTPLHLAFRMSYEKMAVFLLENGADPTVIDSKRFTPLHVICNQTQESGLAQIFFKTIDANGQSVQVNARDDLGRTPLQLAVAKILPNTVDLLLNRGAVLTNLVFPPASYFDDQKSIHNIDDIVYHSYRLIIASGVLAIAERLEKSGYKLDQSGALSIMKMFAKFRWFEKPSDAKKAWCDQEKFSGKASTIKVKQDQLSLLDLVQLRPEEEAKLITYADYFELSQDRKIAKLLIHKRLPIELSEKILEKLNNEDLYKICLAAENIKDSEKGVVIQNPKKAKIARTVPIVRKKGIK